MKTVVITPIQSEIDYFLQACAEFGEYGEELVLPKLSLVSFPHLDLLVAMGGLGKTQFAVQTQYLIDSLPDIGFVICAGAAGAIADWVAIGDVVVGTETVEHDIHNFFGKPLIPRFAGDESYIASFRQMDATLFDFATHFAVIASGDEDVVSMERGQAIHQRTGATTVAWEGAGGARACRFNGLPYLEIRGITDNANHTAASDFAANLQLCQRNVAKYITTWAKVQKSC